MVGGRKDAAAMTTSDDVNPDEPEPVLSSALRMHLDDAYNFVDDISPTSMSTPCGRLRAQALIAIKEAMLLAYPDTPPQEAGTKEHETASALASWVTEHLSKGHTVTKQGQCIECACGATYWPLDRCSQPQTEGA